ncbi:MAG: LolA family protein [Anaerolineae bacterium]
MTSDERQAELLDAYLNDLEHDVAATPPAELEADLADVARGMAHDLQAPEPSAAFTRQLRGRLIQEAQRASAPRRAPSFWGSLVGTQRPVWRIAAVLLLIVALSAVSLWAARPATVNAQEIIAKAQAATALPADGGIRTLAWRETWRTWFEGPEGPVNAGETERWYEAPSRFRIATVNAMTDAEGNVKRSSTLLVGDGTDVWYYEPDEGRVTVNRLSGESGLEGITFFGQSAGDLTTLLEQSETCYDARVTGSDTVAGRDAYVIDLGPSKCPSASAPDTNGRRIIWVDKETYLVLKQELYSADGQELMTQSEVTSVQYNVALDSALFIFEVPDNVDVIDGRPQALPTGQAPTAVAIEMATPQVTVEPQQAALLAALEDLAQGAEFPFFVPEDVPAGLAPRLPKLQETGVEGGELWIEYVPADEVAEDTFATLRIVEQRATYEIVTNWTQGAAPIAMPEGKGWVRRGAQSLTGATDSAVLALRDGTLVSLNSFTLTPEELYELAKTLQTVPGSRAPLPEPQAPTLEELRAQAPYPLFVPTWVPEGLTPAAPLGYEITYYDAKGQAALVVLNGTYLAEDPRYAGEEVALPNGLAAHLLDMPAESGGPILWWVQEGTPIAISGPQLTQEDLLQIAESMLSTADLGQTRERVEPTPLSAVPTPAATPTPAFAFPRPIWLPEPMVERVQADGDIVTLGYIPEGRANEVMPPALLITILPKALAGSEEVTDPQASVEQIGGREVTVIRRGAEGCVTYTWDEGDLRLTLTNVYDPPGTLKYTCDQMRQIVASFE